MFLSHAFLHGSLLHMVMNMTILLALGRFTADHYGARAILPVFCLGAIGGGAVYGLIAGRRLPDGGGIGGGLRLPRALDRLGLAAAPRGGVSTGPVLRRVGVLVLINVVTLIGLQGHAGLGGAPRRLPRRARLRLLDGGPARRNERAARAETRRQRQGDA